MPMFFQAKPETIEPAPAAPTPPANEIRPTCLGPDIQVKGELIAREDIFVQGCIEGSIKSDAQVVVQSSGRLQADVSAKRIEVHGTVVGDLVATEMVVLGAEGRLIGNITAPSVAVSQGAIFHGFTRSGKEAASSEAPAPSPGEEAEEPGAPV